MTDGVVNICTFAFLCSSRLPFLRRHYGHSSVPPLKLGICDVFERNWNEPW